MDLNVWTSTTFLDGNYDEQAERWTIRLQRADGSIRELHPRHLVVAGGRDVRGRFHARGSRADHPLIGGIFGEPCRRVEKNRWYVS
jgi:hypothetical protein